jgi:uncharacterized membrane protein
MNKVIRFIPFLTGATLLNLAHAQEHFWRGRGPGWGLFEGLLQLLFLILIVLGIIFLVQALRSRGLGSPRRFDLSGIKPTTPPMQDAALQILRERLARGEIDPRRL